MDMGVLPLFLALCAPVRILGSEVLSIDMCKESNATSPELILLNNGQSYTSNSDVCSCNISSDKDYYISLKKFKQTTDQQTTVISMTHSNKTWAIDLPTMKENGTHCLLLSGQRCQPFRPRSCLSNTNSNSITLESYKNLTGDSYIYLYILAEGKVSINCKSKNKSYINDPVSYQIININSNRSKDCYTTVNDNNNSTNVSDVSNNTLPESCENTTIACDDPPEETSTTADTTVTIAPTNESTDGLIPALLAKQQEAERMMTASMIMLPIAGIVLLISLLLFALAFRKQRHYEEAIGTKRKSISRRTQKQEPPSYYEEVDEDLHISTDGPISTVSKDNQNKPAAEYDLARNPDVESLVADYNGVTALDNNNYDVATQMAADANRGVVTEKKTANVESEYNVASYNPAKKKSTAGVEGAYDVTQPIATGPSQHDNDGMVYEMGVALDNLDVCIDLDQTGSQKSLISADLKYEPAQLTPMSSSLPSVDTEPDNGNVYSLQRMVSSEEKPEDVMDNDVIYDNNEQARGLATSIERTSIDTDVLDEELYANFSSLKSEDHGTTQQCQENTSDSEEEIYINHPVHTTDRQHSGEPSPKTRKMSVVPENNTSRHPGYINVQLDEQKKSQSTELPDSGGADEGEANIIQEVDDTGSTVCLLNSSETEVYANYERDVDNSKMEKKDKKVRKSKGDKDGTNSNESASKGKRRSKGVEVIVLPQASPAPTTVQQQTKGHKPSSSVDESSKFQRKPDSRKQRTRSDDTFLLNPLTTATSGSEDDVPVVANNLLYDSTNSGSLDPMLSNQACANPSSQTDPNQFLMLPTEEDADDDAIIMMKNDLYESFNCGGVSILPENVSKEMMEKLMKKNHVSPVNESRYTESEKL